MNYKPRRRITGLLTGFLFFLSAAATAAEPVPARTDDAIRQSTPAYRDTGGRGAAGDTGYAEDTVNPSTPGNSCCTGNTGNTCEAARHAPAPDTTGRRATDKVAAGPGTADKVAAGTASRGAARRTSGYRAGYETGYRAGYAAGYRAGMNGDRKQAAATTPPLSSFTADTTARQRLLVHSIGAEFRPEYIPPTNLFLAGANMAGEPIERSLAAHLRYSFRFRPGSRPACIYGGVYQGIGLSYYSFGNREELGNPAAIYLFQGARIARIAPRVSFNYEWNFGLSFGWKPYDANYNRNNVMMGSRVNAYLNVDFYLNWILTQRIELTTGLSMTHFSNGNTKFPNAGLNSIGAKIGLVYSFGKIDNPLQRTRPRLLTPPFPRHFSYDLVLFGSWRRKGVAVGDKQYAAPDAYGVAGFNFAAMYNFGYKFRAGLSLDGVYDGSANVYTEDYIVGYDGGDPGYQFHTPSFDKQIALGLSGRAEFVMPYFTVGFGLGFNMLHKGGDLKSFYQMLTLKVGVTRNTFVHVGYCLKDFQDPNYLMLGVGFRFNNKYPRLR